MQQGAAGVLANVSRKEWNLMMFTKLYICMRKVIVCWFCRKKKDGGRVCWTERPGFSPPTLWRLSVQRTKSRTMICLNLSQVKVVLCGNKCALSKRSIEYIWTGCSGFAAASQASYLKGFLDMPYQKDQSNI